ncbi:MAG TPA: HAD family hydrolase [Polyangiaceae bacterium]|jgi:phosphonatase-like hydrolase
MHIELVVFGFVGTTVLDDGLFDRPLREAFARFDLAPDDATLDALSGYALPHAVRALLERARPGVTPPAAEIERIHDDVVSRIVARASQPAPLAEVLGASQTLWQLHQRGLKTAAITGLSMNAAGALHDRLGWRARGLLDVCITSDDVERGAPFPDAIYEAMHRAGVRESARVLVVTGEVSELQQASAAGCGLVVGVFDTGSAFERLRRAPHNVLLPTCALVPELLRRLDARRFSAPRLALEAASG